MRITCGCRNGYIAGGAQGEAPMLRASRTEGSCAAMIITSGCRGCNMKGIWPGVRETTAHALLGCAGKQVGDLISWCAAVEKKLTYMIEYTKRKIGDDACTMCAQLTRALEAVKDRGVSEVNFMALRHTVGGKLPWWDHNKEERDIKYNGAMIEHVTQLQDLFIERTKAWCAYVAPATWRRQARWESRHWVRMLLHILRHNAKGRWARRRAVRYIGAKLIYAYREDGPALRTQHVTRTTRKQAVRRRMRRVIWDLVYNQDELVLVLQIEYHKGKKVDEERVGKVEAWVDAAHHKKDRGHALVGRITHAMKCLITHIRIVHRVEEATKREREVREGKEKMRKRMKWTNLLRAYREEKQRDLLAHRLEQREGRVCASTRNVGRLKPKGGVTYDETKRHTKRIGDEERYRVWRWPRRDKCGPTLVHLLYDVWDIT